MDTKQTKTTIPRIYVACLAAYNSGYLHGAWIDADKGENGIRDGINAMLNASPIADAEEYAIHDYDGFEGVRIEEYTGIIQIVEIAGFLIEHGALGGAVVAHFCGNMEEARDALKGCYHGEFSSLADYMQEVTEESVPIPDALRYYIDWEAMARDAAMSGDLFTIETAHDEVHVFAG